MKNVDKKPHFETSNDSLAKVLTKSEQARKDEILRQVDLTVKTISEAATYFLTEPPKSPDERVKEAVEKLIKKDEAAHPCPECGKPMTLTKSARPPKLKYGTTIVGTLVCGGCNVRLKYKKLLVQGAA